MAHIPIRANFIAVIARANGTRMFIIPEVLFFTGASEIFQSIKMMVSDGKSVL